MTNNTLLLGAHMSIAGGIENAYYRGASIDCTAIQFFTHSNRQWAMKKLTKDTILQVKKAQKETGIAHAVVHASYLINVASTSPETRQKSKNMLRMELEYCSLLGIKYLVLHPGSNPLLEEGISLISQGLNELFDADQSNTVVLLENMAGQGNQIGSTFDQLAAIKSAVHNKKRIGFCIDTCHLWAAGYDFSNEKNYKQVWDEFDTILGLKHLKAIHINDSKQPCDSHVDRHENIGKGTIGLEGFTLLMNDSRLIAIPKLLETPGKELTDWDKNMTTLKNLLRR